MTSSESVKQKAYCRYIQSFLLLNQKTMVDIFWNCECDPVEIQWRNQVNLVDLDFTFFLVFDDTSFVSPSPGDRNMLAEPG